METNAIHIEVAENGTLIVKAPYHPDFPARARNLGGNWHAPPQTWHFDGRDLERVRALCLEIYGTDGTPETSATLTLRVTCRSRKLKTTEILDIGDGCKHP
jgi:hypothetical protein